MAAHSDLTVNASKFRPEAISEEAKTFNESLMDNMKRGPKWFQVQKYRIVE